MVIVDLVAPDGSAPGGSYDGTSERGGEGWKDLIALALCSPRFGVLCQRRLYSQISIRDEWDNLKNLHTFFLRKPALMTYIRHMHFSSKGESYAGRRAAAPVVDFLQILAKSVPARLGLFFEWKDLPVGIRSAIINILGDSGRTIRELRLEGVDSLPVSCLQGLQGLERLSLGAVSLSGIQETASINAQEQRNSTTDHATNAAQISATPHSSGFANLQVVYVRLSNSGAADSVKCLNEVLFVSTSIRKLQLHTGSFTLCAFPLSSLAVQKSNSTQTTACLASSLTVCRALWNCQSLRIGRIRRRLLPQLKVLHRTQSTKILCSIHVPGSQTASKPSQVRTQRYSTSSSSFAAMPAMIPIV